MKKEIKANINTQLILKFLKENNLSKKAFCEKYNYSLSSLNNVFKQNANINFSVVCKLSKILNIEVKDMFLNKKV